jgi:predicted dehydrogenase
VTLRVGVIGTGFARRVQVPGLSLVPGAQVTAVASGRRENATAVAAEFGIPHAYDDGLSLATSEDVDLVIVSSTPPSHASLAVAALEAGKHVLCEKPMALNAPEAEWMVEVAERHPAQLAWIDHELRYDPVRRRVRELLRSGAIGQLRHIELSLKPYLRGDGRPQMTTAPWTWWFDRDRGGGILGAVGSHLIDLCRYWSGGEVTWAAGRVATFIGERDDERGVSHPVTADEFASFVLTLRNSVVATLTLSTVAWHGPGHLAQITGSEGTLVITGERSLAIGRSGKPLEEVDVPDDLEAHPLLKNMWGRAFVRLMRDLAGVLAGQPRTGEPAGFRDGLQVQRVLDVVRQGSGVTLD